MPVVPPYLEETCRCGHGLRPVSVAGRFRGLCAEGKALQLEASRLKRAAKQNGHEHREVADLSSGVKRPKLARVCQDLVVAAEKLERAVDERAASTSRARSALGEFKDTLQMVGRVAQSLVNHPPVTVSSE